MRGAVRLMRLGLCLFLVLSLNFALPRLMPGDPVLMLLGPESVALSQKSYEDLRKEYGLDRSLGEQFVRYWRELGAGRLGTSLHHRRDVASLIGEHLGRTLCLLLPAVFLSTLAAALLGTLAGWRRGSPLDLAVTSLAILGYAMPAFLTAMVLLDLLSHRLGWLPLGGLAPLGGAGGSRVESMAGVLRHLVLPVAVLTAASSAAKLLVMRGSVSAARHEPYVLYARARGVEAWRVPFIHVFRNACLPLLHLTALHLGFVVSGAVLVEVVFSINGMGSLILDAALHRDYPLLQGALLVLTLVVMGLNVLVDAVSELLDPRVRA